MSAADVSKAVGNSSLRAWSNRHARLMEVMYSTFVPVLVALRPLARLIPSKVLKPLIKPAEKTYQRHHVRLSYVRQLHLKFDRHVMPHELSKEFTQWTLRGRT